MGVLDRVRQARTIPEDSRPGVTLVRAELPSVQRLRFVFHQLNDFVGKAGDERARRFNILGKAIMDEILEEMTDNPLIDDATLGIWFAQFGRVVEWIGTGNDDILPDSMQEHVRNYAPKNTTPKALTSAANG